MKKKKIIKKRLIRILVLFILILFVSILLGINFNMFEGIEEIFEIGNEIGFEKTGELANIGINTETSPMILKIIFWIFIIFLILIIIAVVISLFLTISKKKMIKREPLFKVEMKDKI